MDGIVVLLIGVIVVVVLAVVLGRAFPSWARLSQHGEWSDPTGNWPPEPEGFKKPRNEGDLL